MLQIPDPEQPAEASPVHHQGERLLQILTLRSKALEGEKIGNGIAGVTAVAQFLQPVPLRWPQPRRAASQHALPQDRRTSRQRRPAARAPSASSGLSPTCQA